MAVAAERVAIPRPAGNQWWRHKFVLVGAVIGAMVIVYHYWSSGYPWPAALEWNSLSGSLDTFQTWLSDQQSAAHPSFIFSVLNGISTGLGDFVSWLATFFNDLSWT